jgi:hypothetical protein
MRFVESYQALQIAGRKPPNIVEELTARPLLDSHLQIPARFCVAGSLNSLSGTPIALMCSRRSAGGQS